MATARIADHVRRERHRRAGSLAVHRARPVRVGGAGPQDGDPAPARGDPAAPRPGRLPGPRRGAGGLPPAVPPAQPVRRRGRRAAPRAGVVPAPPHPAAHALRDRPGRLRGRGQVHDRAGAAADAGALARAPQRHPDHHRRLPLPQRRARAPRAAAAQGLPRVLRPAGAAAVRGRHQVRAGRGRGADVLPPRLRRGPRREGRGQAPRHRDHRGPQRPPAGPGARGRPYRPGGQRLLRLLRLRRRRHRAHPGLVHLAVPATARDGVPRPRVLLRRSTPTSPTSEAVAEAERIWDTINGPNLAQNVLPTRSRATLVLRKDKDHSVRYVRLRKL